MQGLRSRTLQEVSVKDVVESADQSCESQLEYVDGVLVVKSQEAQLLDLDLVAFINQQREERIQEVGGW